MHVSPLTRRRFLSLAGTAAGGLLTRYAAITRDVVAMESELNDPIENAKRLAKAINSFALDLHSQLVKDGKHTLFFSPFSISSALAMTCTGAKGKTLEEMQTVLRLPDDTHSCFRDLLSHLNTGLLINTRGFELNTANALWAMKGYPWRKEFLDLTRNCYGAGVVETDFTKPESARQQINAWVEKQTHEKIKDLIPQGMIDSLTRLVLTNAIYFKGDWARAFDEELTRTSPFTRIDGTKTAVPLMTQTAEFDYGELTALIDQKAHKVQVLVLPYSSKEVSMWIYLPVDPGVIDKLPHCLANGDIGVEALRRREVQVSLPRFKAESEFSLVPTLMDLGMHAAFVKADFTGMHTSSEPLYIAAVLHKAFVEVNEKGTEAAAATAVVMKRAIGQPPRIFQADRPFLFTIRDNRTGTNLFMGRYNGPV